MTNDVTERVTPMSGSSINEIIRSAHSFCTMSGYLRYRRRRVSAAFFLTNAFDVLQPLAVIHHSKRQTDLRGYQKPMNIIRQRLAHLPPTNISHRMQRQAIIQLIMIQQVLPNTVHHQMQQLVLLMQE